MNSDTGKNSFRQDYRIYRFSKKEKIKYYLIGFIVSSLMLYFFYQYELVIFPAILAAHIYCRWQNRQLREIRIKNLEWQFSDWIAGVAASIQSGYSVENAFIRAGRELGTMYKENTDIRIEMKNMENMLANNFTIEQILSDLGERSGSQEIRNFSDVFSVGKRSGGNIREMIESYCEIISLKTDVEKDIQLLIHGKIMEQKIMCLVPFIIILYISITSPGYFEPLYHNLMGIVIMSICLFIYALSVKLSMYVVKIEV